MQTTIKLSGLTCPACKKLIEKRLGTISGIDRVDVRVDLGEAVIDSDQVIQLSEIKEVLKDTPYQIIK